MGLQGSEVPGPAQVQHSQGISSIHPGEQKKGEFFRHCERTEWANIFPLNMLVDFYWWEYSSGNNTHIFYVKKDWIFLKVWVRITQGAQPATHFCVNECLYITYKRVH